jgi:hypothetical protein
MEDHALEHRLYFLARFWAQPVRQTDEDMDIAIGVGDVQAPVEGIDRQQGGNCPKRQGHGDTDRAGGWIEDRKAIVERAGRQDVITVRVGGHAQREGAHGHRAG